MNFKLYNNRERDYLDEEDSEEESEEKRRRWRTSFGGVAANSVMNGVGGFYSFLINALSLSLSLSLLSHTETESLKNLAPRKKLHREMKQKKIHLSESALGGFVLVSKLQH